VFLSALLIAVALLACVTDLLEQRIYNVLTFPALLVGVMMHVAGGVWWDGLAGAAAIGAPYFLLFAFNVMKAGDVKLLMALGALGGWRFALLLAFAAFVSSALLHATVLVVERRLGDVLRIMRPEWTPDHSFKTPFGVGIALAVIGLLAIQTG